MTLLSSSFFFFFFFILFFFPYSQILLISLTVDLLPSQPVRQSIESVFFFFLKVKLKAQWKISFKFLHESSSIWYVIWIWTKKRPLRRQRIGGLLLLLEIKLSRVWSSVIRLLYCTLLQYWRLQMSHITGRHLWIIFRNALLSYFVKWQTVGPFVMKQIKQKELVACLKFCMPK